MTSLLPSSSIDHRDIATRASDYAKKLINALPHIKILFGEDKNPKARLFGGIIREIIYTIIHNPSETPERLIERYLMTQRGDVDIDVWVKHDVLRNFFRAVVANGGLIEMTEFSYNGRSRSIPREKLPIDISNANSVVLDGCYFVYVKHQDSFIKYDLSFNMKNSTKNLDFGINGGTYPINSKENFYVAVFDVADKKLRFVRHNAGYAKLIYRAARLYAKGYRFDNDGHIQRVMSACVKNGPNRYDGEIHAMDTSYPSVTGSNSKGKEEYNTSPTVRNPNEIVITRHKTTGLSAKTLLDSPLVMKMLDETPLPIRSWHLPDSGNGQGITVTDVTVYKAAMAHLYTRPPTYKDILSDSNYVNRSVLIELEIPRFTRYNREFHSGYLKFRFEKAFVRAIFAYPRRLLDDSVQVHSDYDRTFVYTVGQIVIPDKDYDSRSDSACSHGIHAFLDETTAWCYFSQEKLIDFQITAATIPAVSSGSDESE